MLNLSYSNEIARPDDLLMDALRQKLRLLGVDPGPFTEIKGPYLFRQDRTDAYDQKVSNWHEFSSALKSHPDYFLAFQE